MSNSHPPEISVADVVAREREQLQRRRENLSQTHGTEQQPNWFGIALSGGGIRSATINMGFLRTLNRFGILRQADYLSTVSGGGYTHSYVQGTLKQTGEYSALFTDDHAKEFRQHGEYMTPGQGWVKNKNLLILIVAFLVSWLMSLVSLIIVGGIVYFAHELITTIPGLATETTVGAAAVHREGDSIFPHIYWWSLGAILLAHFLTSALMPFNLNLSKFFNLLEAVAAVIGIVILIGYKAANYSVVSGGNDWWVCLAVIAGFILLGFAANPNGLSFHRFYRKQLADLYLRFATDFKNHPLHDFFKVDSKREADYLAPYPLINTCMNLQNPTGEDAFKGVKASDYFLLSPLFCGSKITGYAPTTKFSDFKKMTLPAAVTISAAAVNPGLGIYSSKVKSAALTLFNARLGCWVSNPKSRKPGTAPWWPWYFFSELLGRIGTKKQMVNVSDGGHIENLGVYELLRRGCRLIISVDAGQDALYTFADLNNLLLRARNELGLEIRFREGQEPEKVIAPQPSTVYSKKRFAVADVIQHWASDKVCTPAEFNGQGFPRKIGTFVYVKSSVTEPSTPPPPKPDADLKYSTYYYKIYHPEFPHESTGDQFFDPVQWESYYRLGQYLGADMLGLGLLGKASRDFAPQFSVEQLINWFDKPEQNPLFSVAERRLVAKPDQGFESVNSGAGGEETVKERSAQPPEEEDEYRI